MYSCIYTYIHMDCINKYWPIVWMCIYCPLFSDYGWIHTPWYAHCVIVEPTFWVCLTGYSQYIPIPMNKYTVNTFILLFPSEYTHFDSHRDSQIHILTWRNIATHKCLFPLYPHYILSTRTPLRRSSRSRKFASPSGGSWTKTGKSPRSSSRHAVENIWSTYEVSLRKRIN